MELYGKSHRLDRSDPCAREPVSATGSSPGKEVVQMTIWSMPTVFVREYERFRFGRVEHVRSHTRRWPR